MMSDQLSHASAVLDQIRQAEAEGDLPDKLAAKYDLDEDANEEIDHSVND